MTSRAECSSPLIAVAATVRARHLWLWELQRLANKAGMIFEACHYPTGTSKWNKIEHRLFCQPASVQLGAICV